jgi:hypothetical protein
MGAEHDQGWKVEDGVGARRIGDLIHLVASLALKFSTFASVDCRGASAPYRISKMVCFDAQREGRKAVYGNLRSST